MKQSHSKPKTLYYDKRKHDAMKIDQDNVVLLSKITNMYALFVLRLNFSKPTIPNAKLMEEYQRQRYYKQLG